MNLARLAFPDSGPQVLTVRLKQTGTPSISVGVILWQGTRAITAASFQPTTSFADCTIHLSAAEIARITDYANLQVEVASPVLVSCCPDGLPAVLQPCAIRVIPGSFGQIEPCMTPMAADRDRSRGGYGVRPSIRDRRGDSRRWRQCRRVPQHLANRHWHGLAATDYNVPGVTHELRHVPGRDLDREPSR